MNFDFSQMAPLITAYGVKIVGVIFLAASAWLVAGYARFATRMALQRARFDVTLTKFFSNMARWSILVVATISILGVFGVQATSFAAVIAAVGLAVGLAFQGTLSNFASGVMLLVFRPFKVGDNVKVAGQFGRVDELDLFTTSMDTPDGRRIILPNSAIFGATIENTTYHRTRRVDLDISLDAVYEVDYVRRNLEKAARQVTGARAEPAVAVILNNVTAATSDWQLQIWAESDSFGKVREQALRSLRSAIDAIKAGREL